MIDEFARLLKSYPVGEQGREILANGTPAWQRLQAVRCLIAYRALVWGESDDSLAGIRAKLAELAANESMRGG